MAGTAAPPDHDGEGAGKKRDSIPRPVFVIDRQCWHWVKTGQASAPLVKLDEDDEMAVGPTNGCLLQVAGARMRPRQAASKWQREIHAVRRLDEGYAALNRRGR